MAAVEAMMNLLKGQQVETKRLPAELIERKSTAPPRTAPK
jgi:DNA-binding LacI/PurR family transcriptional regulator